VISFLFLITLAQADGLDCVACCKDAGMVGCPTRIKVHGDGSIVTREAGAWRVSGLWRLDCDTGAKYDDGGTLVMMDQPMAGQVLRLASPLQTVACFARHCTLPQGACLQPRTSGEYALSNCTDNRMLTEAEMMITGQAPVATPSPSTGDVDLTLPPPATRCAEDAALLSAAQAQVYSADAKVGMGNFSGAADTYRAALTIDPCSAGGWAGLGRIATQTGAHTIAVEALETATSLRTHDAGAWAHLGQSYEALGRVSDAIRSYDQALSIDTSHETARARRDALKPAP